MKRGTLIASSVLLVSLLAVAATTWSLVQEDRTQLLNQFAAERANQVADAAELARRDLDAVGEGLRFVARMLETTQSPQDKAREIEALITSTDEYLGVWVDDGAGRARLWVPKTTFTSTPDIEAQLKQNSLQALVRPPGQLEMSVAIVQASSRRTLRVFATRLSSGGAVALLVDTGAMFSKLSLLSAHPSVHLLMLGAHGRPTSISSPRLAAATQEGRLASLVTPMLQGKTGTFWLAEAEAHALGLGTERAVATFVPVLTKNGGRWSVATVTSIDVLRATERALVRRLVTAGILSACVLVVCALYVLASTRRAVRAREQLEELRRVSEIRERTEKILENIPTLVLALSEDLRVRSVNRALREKLGRDVLGAPLLKTFPQAPHSVVQRLHALLVAAHLTGTVKTLAGEHLALFGIEGQFSIRAVPVADHKQPELLLVIDDVSEVTHLESQLLRAEKLSTIGVLSAGIAHEIGTPLGVVRGRAELLLETLGNDHAQAPALATILSQIDRVTRTIRQLLDFSRIQPVLPRTVDLEPTLRGVVDLVEYEARRRGVSIALDSPGGLPAIAADPDQLQQVFVNLVMNAFDACAQKGHVRLKMSLDTSAQPDGWKRVRVDVLDDGCGIAPSFHEQVFDPFFTTKKRGKGTGLGLTTAAQIVRNHGGEIFLESSPGKGTCVSVCWPIANEGRPETRLAAHSS